jgi:hypothetical protein
VQPIIGFSLRCLALLVTGVSYSGYWDNEGNWISEISSLPRAALRASALGAAFYRVRDFPTVPPESPN